MQFFVHVISTDAYSEFNIKDTFETSKLTDSNFASKVNPSQKYPACEVDTENLFDEDGDPIFQPQIPGSPEASALTTGRRNLREKLDRP